MAKMTDKIEELPYVCEDCKHFLSGLKCRAFDLIPLEIYGDTEAHTSIVPGQKGDYVFATDKPRDTMRVYVDGDEDPDA